MGRRVAITLDGRHISVVETPEGVSVLRVVAGTPGEDAFFERIELTHGRVALRSSTGSYLALHARHEGQDCDGAPHLSAELTQCAAFEEVLLPCGQVSLRGCDLHYLGVHRNGHVVADRIVNGSRERFTYLEVPARPARDTAPDATPDATPDAAPGAAPEAVPVPAQQSPSTLQNPSTPPSASTLQAGYAVV